MDRPVCGPLIVSVSLFFCKGVDTDQFRNQRRLFCGLILFVVKTSAFFTGVRNGIPFGLGICCFFSGVVLFLSVLRGIHCFFL